MTNVLKTAVEGVPQEFPGGLCVRPGKKDCLAVIEVIGVVASLVTLTTGGMAVFDWLEDTDAIVIVLVLGFIIGAGVILYKQANRRELELFVCDENDYPRPNVAADGPGGPRYADERGKMFVPADWCGQAINFHEVKSWRLLGTSVITNRPERRVIKIVLKNMSGNDGQ